MVVSWAGLPNARCSSVSAALSLVKKSGCRCSPPCLSICRVVAFRDSTAAPTISCAGTCRRPTPRGVNARGQRAGARGATRRGSARWGDGAGVRIRRAAARGAARAALARRGLRRPRPYGRAGDERGRGVIHKVGQGPSASAARSGRSRARPDESRTSPGPTSGCSATRWGEPSTDPALRRRYRRAQAAAGLRALRWHDLRHTYGSLLAAAGVDLVTIQAAMGHGALATTGRYLHARPASDQAAVFTRAFESASGVSSSVRQANSAQSKTGLPAIN